MIHDKSNSEVAGCFLTFVYVGSSQQDCCLRSFISSLEGAGQEVLMHSLAPVIKTKKNINRQAPFLLLPSDGIIVERSWLARFPHLYAVSFDLLQHCGLVYFTYDAL